MSPGSAPTSSAKWNTPRACCVARRCCRSVVPSALDAGRKPLDQFLSHRAVMDAGSGVVAAGIDAMRRRLLWACGEMEEHRSQHRLAPWIVGPTDRAPQFAVVVQRPSRCELGAYTQDFAARRNDLVKADVRQEDHERQATVAPSGVAEKLLDRLSRGRRTAPPLALVDEQRHVETRIRRLVLPETLKDSACAAPSKLVLRIGSRRSRSSSSPLPAYVSGARSNDLPMARDVAQVGIASSAGGGKS
jgi:hypothetical protein